MRPKLLIIFMTLITLMLYVASATPPPPSTLPATPNLTAQDIIIPIDNQSITTPVDIPINTGSSNTRITGGGSSSPNLILNRINNTVKTSSISSTTDIIGLENTVNSLQSQLDIQSKAIQESKTEMIKLNEKLDQFSLEFLNSRSSPLSYMPVIGACVLMIILTTSFFILIYLRIGKIKNSREEDKKETNAMTTNAAGNAVNAGNSELLRNYISTNLKKGYTPIILRQALARQGYSIVDINTAFGK
jgi:hypothetical protein